MTGKDVPPSDAEFFLDSLGNDPTPKQAKAFVALLDLDGTKELVELHATEDPLRTLIWLTQRAQMPAPDQCPPPDDLRKTITWDLPIQRQIQVVAHIATGCQTCRDTVFDSELHDQATRQAREVAERVMKSDAVLKALVDKNENS